MELGSDISDTELDEFEEEGFPPPIKLEAEDGFSPPIKLEAEEGFPPAIKSEPTSTTDAAPVVAAAPVDAATASSTSSDQKRRFEEAASEGLLLDVNDDSIVEVPLHSVAKGQVRHFRTLLKGDKLLADAFEVVDRRVLPEVFARTFSSDLCLKKRVFRRISAILQRWHPSFSLDEKRRFLKGVARCPKTIMLVWFDLIEWTKFDAMMVINSTQYDHIVRRVVQKLEDEPQMLMAKLATWVDFKIPQALEIIRQSPFNCPEYEGYNLSRLEGTRIRKFIKTISGFKNQPFPPSITLSVVCVKMERVLAAFSKQEITPRDIMLSVEQAVDADSRIRRIVDVMIGSSEAGAIYNRYKTTPVHLVPHVDECWEAQQCPNVEYSIEEIDDSSTTPWIIRQIEQANAPIPVVFRIDNQFDRQARIATLMFQLPKSPTKYRMDTFGTPSNFKRNVLDALFRKQVSVFDVNCFTSAAIYTFGIAEDLIMESFIRVNKAGLKNRLQIPGPRHVANLLGVPYCPGSRQRVLRGQNDLNDSFVWHMAKELAILVAFSERKRELATLNSEKNE